MRLFPRARRAGIILAGYNEGENLLKTVESCLETTEGVDCEIVIANDASTDGSVEAVLRRHPDVRVVSHRTRRGTSATKDLGGRRSRGEVLLFIDAHCKPEPSAVEILINDVEESGGDAIFTPRVPALDCERWENSPTQIGHGYSMRLDVFECSWIGLEAMQRRGRYYECPALIGCCVAMSRRLYEKLWGFDRHMIDWGVEDIDAGLKAWLMGHPILHDPYASIGHRFRMTFDTFSVTSEGVLVNQLRMARKNFTESTWNRWVEVTRGSQPPELWSKTWTLFCRGQRSLERERAYLQAHRVRDEIWYARRFGLDWPPS